MKISILVVFLMGLFVTVALGFDAVLTDDTSLTLSGTSGKKPGASPTLLVDGKHAALLKFDLTSLPADLTKSSLRATLTVFINRVTKAGAIHVSRIVGEWQETASPSVTLIPVDGQTGVISKDAGKGFVRFDVTDLVIGWVNGTVANDGFAITADASNPGVALALDSKENPATGHQAVLNIDFTDSTAFLHANKGMWQEAANYEAGDIVTFSGSTWIATAASTNSQPTAANAKWSVLAARGDAGPSGPSGPTGSTGPTGSIAPLGLRHTLAKIQGILSGSRTGRINVLTWGDSVSTVLWDQLQFTLRRTYGNSGLGMAKPVIALSGGATNVTDDFSKWVTGNYYKVPSGETVTWSGAGNGMDTLDVYYLKEPGAGTFKIQSNNGSGWVDETTVDASNTTTVGAYATVSKSAGNYQLRVVGVTRTVTIVGGAILSSSNGIAFFTIGYPGILLTSMNATPEEILRPILERINPDILSFEMKDPEESLTAGLPVVLARWKAAAPNCDYVLCASNPVDPATFDDAGQRAQNAILERHAADNGCMFYDGYAIFGSYAPIAVNHWSDDGVHLNPAGAYYSAQHLARFLGFWETGILSASAGAIDRVTINGSPIGQTTPAAGAFTTLSALTPLAQSSGGTGLSSLPKFRAQLSSMVKVPSGTPTTLSFGTVKAGSTGFSGSKWTPGKVGDFNVSFYLSADVSNWSVILKRNGADLVYLSNATTTKNTAVFSAIVETGAVTDYFEIEVSQNSGGDLFVYNPSYFAGFIIP